MGVLAVPSGRLVCHDRPDGTYTFAGLPAGTDYELCFQSRAATGGSSGSSGYLGECYENLPLLMGGTSKPVVVGYRWAHDCGCRFCNGRGSLGHGDRGRRRQSTDRCCGHGDQPLTWDFGFALTDANGVYSVTGLPAGTNYFACFDASVTPAPFPTMPTPVIVTLGPTTPRIDAAMASGGAISGKVTDAGGDHGGLRMADVMVCSDSASACWALRTAADGRYTLTGLPAATNYTVDFMGSSATGGSSDATGYEVLTGRTTWPSSSQKPPRDRRSPAPPSAP